MSFEFVNIIRVKMEQFRKDLLYCIETIGRTLHGVETQFFQVPQLVQ